MRKTSDFPVDSKISVSLASIVGRKAANLRPPAAAFASGYTGTDPETIQDSDSVSALLHVQDAQLVGQAVNLGSREELLPLGDSFLSANVSPDTLNALLADPTVLRIQSKKQSQLLLDQALPEVGVGAPGSRNVLEDGSNVLIGIVDSGFDLSHPMFREDNGDLRVESLLDQTDSNREYNTQALETGWANGSNPGRDTNGHGTHVASIAAGSLFQNQEGVAPGARFLLVKTDMINTDKAVSWVFNKADSMGRACVVNMSLGHHWGSHDGTSVEERLHEAISGPGKIIVVAAGNERNDPIHIGGRFAPGTGDIARFDLLWQQNGLPWTAITAWYDDSDIFAATVVTPSGQQLPIPGLNQTSVYQSSIFDIELSRKAYAWSSSVQIQALVSVRSSAVRSWDLRNWQFQFRCTNAVVGRIDAWVNNSGFAAFRTPHLVETARTIGLPASGTACVAVASHVTKQDWLSDNGPMSDSNIVNGRTSPFSSQGPTRDGRSKPDISAPGQYITAALADGSGLSNANDRALVNSRLVSIEGTSMAAPVVTGAIALMLQKNPSLTPDAARTLLADNARKDGHTGVADWTIDYGHGKLDIPAILSAM